MKDLRVTNIVKELKFGKVCGKLKLKKISRDNQPQNI